jgi:signal transduction histidine kinase
MRERAALLGGSLETRRSEHAFQVDARLPYTGPEQR